MKAFQSRLFILSGALILIAIWGLFAVISLGEGPTWDRFLLTCLLSILLLVFARWACSRLARWCLAPMVHHFFWVANQDNADQSEGENEELDRIPEMAFLKNHIQYMSGYLEKTTTELEEQAAEIVAIQESKINFIRNLFSEVRMPLNSVLGMCEILKETMPEGQQALVNILYQSGHDLSQIVTNMITLSNLDSGRLENDLQWLELKPFVNEVIQEALGTVDTTSTNMEVECEDDLPNRIFYDPYHLKQMVFALARTPFKLTHGGTLTFRIQNQSEEHLRFVVQDPKLRLDSNDFNQLFERFSLISDDDGKDLHLKTGIGLALVRDLAEFNGGSAEVSNSDKEGTKFWFTIPLETTKEMEKADAVDLEPIASDDPFKSDFPLS